MQVQRTPSVSPARPAHDKSVSERTSRSENWSRHHVPLNAQVGSGAPGEAEGAGLASQLQAVIRDELRRIMEIQHRSVLAMMGALDQVGATQPQHLGEPAVPHTTKPASSSQRGEPAVPHTTKPASSSQRGKSGRSQASLAHGPRDMTANQEDESVAEMLSLKEEIVAHAATKTQAQPRRSQREHPMRAALTELHNLQSQNVQPQENHDASYGDEISSRASRIFSHHQSLVGDPPRDANVRLPLLAWEEKPQQAGPFPLLHMDLATPDPFANLRRFLPQVPPPHNYPSSTSFSQPQQATGPTFAAALSQASQQHEGGPNLPLLSVQTASVVPQWQPGLESFPFLRMVPPGHSEAQVQRSRLEETRQRLLRNFQEHILQDKENQEQVAAAHQLLHLPHQQHQPQAKPLDTASMSEKAASDQEESKREAAERALSEHSGGLDTTLSDGGHTGSAHGVAINDGYALPRGIFESYLQLGEHLMGPEAGHTSAAFQLKMAQAMQRQVEKRITGPKVDFSTMTNDQADAAMLTDPAMEVVRTAEAATSITKDTGVDPIEEAVREHNLQRHNNLVPPDIFMGLRFADLDGQAGVADRAPSDQPGKGRSYLNVVDIRASAVLRDIPERQARPEQGQQEAAHTDLAAAMLESQRAALQMGTLEQSLREKLAPRTSATGGHGQDSITVRMFDQLKAGRDDRVSVAVMPRRSMSEPKSAMLRRLQDMSDQIRAIDDMSQNIEREFKSSHLLLNTIQDVNASIQRSRSPSPDRPKVSQARRKELRYSLEDQMEEYEDEFEEAEDMDAAKPLTPRLPKPKASSKSPQASSRSARSKSSLASMSGSELTELLSEVLAEQGVDMESAGYPRDVAQQLEREARDQMTSQHHRRHVSPRGKLETMKRQEERLEQRTEEEREELKKWMAAKFHERQGQYKRLRQQLIEKEAKPFKSGSAASRQNLHKLSEERSERRNHMAADFMSQRLSQAEHLMGSIIVDRPEMPSRGPLPSADAGAPVTQSGSRSTFGGRGGHRKSRSPGRRYGPTSHRPALANQAPSEAKEMPAAVKGILKPSTTSTTLAGEQARFSSSDLHLGNLASLSAEGLSVDSSADIVNYARQILEMEETGPVNSYEMSAPQPSHVTRSPGRSPGREGREARQAKVKSFADIVRLQRPTVTRKWQEVTRQRQLQVAASHQQAATGGSLGGHGTWTLDPNLVNGKPKEYGSKKIPGSSPRLQTEGGPARRVKTYAERLQEMKPSTRIYSPPASRGIPGSARTTGSGVSRSTGHRGPAHKPQTYVQQLKSLGARSGSVQRPASARGKVPVRMRTFLRSHGPVHQPKTYTEQLKELNPHPHSDVASSTTRRRPTQSSGPASSVDGVSRATSRPRPYGDPYSEMDYEELASVLSDWDMDENVKNIIYGGSTVASSVAFRDDVDVSMSGGDVRRAVAPSDGQSDYFDVVMQGDGPYRPPLGEDGYDLGVGDYRSSVDIHEIERIADAASVGSGSVLSVIDWDAVNDLIKDV